MSWVLLPKGKNTSCLWACHLAARSSGFFLLPVRAIILCETLGKELHYSRSVGQWVAFLVLLWTKFWASNSTESGVIGLRLVSALGVYYTSNKWAISYSKTLLLPFGPRSSYVLKSPIRVISQPWCPPPALTTWRWASVPRPSPPSSLRLWQFLLGTEVSCPMQSALARTQQ